MSARADRSCASLMKVGPSSAMVATSLTARRSCCSAERRAGRPRITHRFRSRMKAITKGVRRVATERLRVMRLTRAGPPARGGGSTRAPRDLSDERLLDLVHEALHACVRVFGVVEAQHVERAVHHQPHQLFVERHTRVRGLARCLIHTDVYVSQDRLAVL